MAVLYRHSVYWRIVPTTWLLARLMLSRKRGTVYVSRGLDVGDNSPHHSNPYEA